MKKIRSIHKKWPAILAFSSLLTVSCKKLIEIPPNPISQIPQQQVFTDSADIMSALVGIYANFKTTGGGPSFTSGEITVYTGLSADELLASNANDFLANAITVNDGTVEGMWKQAYSDIYQMNACLQGIGSTTVIIDSVKQQLLGEIRVVRALYYFNLVNLFGGVPVVTGTDYTTNATIPRAAADSVYSLIKSDLAAARSVLTPNYPSGGRARPNLYTAEALSARVYLYLQQWDSAALMAGQVIQSGQYYLEPNLNNVFLDGSNEAIWQLPAAGTSYQTAEAATFIPYLSNSAPPYTSYSPPSYPLSPNLTGAFETGDQRQANWVTTITVSTSVYPIAYKYKNRTAIAPTVEDYMVLRLSEQYLILAEALAHQNQLNDAVTSLNLVRTRAGLSGSNAATQADVLSAILHERQTELFCEWGNRWYDLKRTGTIDAVLGAEKTGWQPNAALYPIPLIELQSNPFLVQNLGY
jgi:starch-binding outer membrane protein, SusD/RagB family